VFTVNLNLTYFEPIILYKEIQCRIRIGSTLTRNESTYIIRCNFQKYDGRLSVVTRLSAHIILCLLQKYKEDNSKIIAIFRIEMINRNQN
jgi:hypothetical protein